MLIFPTLIFTFAWLFEFRKLSEVYIEEKYLIIDDKKISFKDVISIERRNWPTYKVKYNSGELIKYFLFLPKINQLFLIEELRNKIFK